MMRTLAFCGLALVCATGARADFIYPGFGSTAGLTLNGSTTTPVTGDGTVLRLTPAAIGQGGSAFTTSQISLGAGAEFSTFFQFRFTNPGGISPADGIAFVLQTVNNNVGGAGGGLGYMGIANSVAIEFDTYPNGPSAGDPNGNHVAIDTNGALNGSGVTVNGQINCTNVATVTGTPNCMANGDIWSVWIDYDGTNIKVALADNSLVRPANIIDQAINISGFLGATSAYVGFTGATGAGFENHDILNWQLVQRFAPIDPVVVPEPSSWVLLGTAGSLFGFAFYKRRTRSA
jgi:hypothetical protein